MVSPGCNVLPVLSDNKLGLILSIFKYKTHVQTARESHDLNMDFRSFDNGFKQLCVTNFYARMKIWTTTCDFGTYGTLADATFNPHADTVELKFIFFHIYRQKMLWCV